ncbi:MAG TPA: leucyl aminopeptidase family protein [Thermohalobaculum sp.]|nr:leucyl aminopeptidase family protein [Thermohalobaculum sp.]
MSDTIENGSGAQAAGDGVPLALVPADALDDVLAALPAAEAAWARANGFRGRLGTHLSLPAPDGSIARVLIGWGTEEKRRRGRFHLGRFARAAPAGHYRLDAELDPEDAAEAALGWRLGRYRFERYKKGASRGEATLAPPPGTDDRLLDLIARGVFLTRDLINTPANDMGPAALEDAVRRLAEAHGAEISVTKGDALLERNFPLIHTVGRGAADAPRLIELTWGAKSDPAVTLVGKGVCFDTGGLNLKPGASMALMKKDMGGAATMLGLAHMVMGAGLRVRLRLLIPAVENVVAGSSFRPGDVLTARNGLTVEVNNTDAEGRLVLADALALAAEAEPALILDAATLTGAARVALGPDLAACFTDDEALAGALESAGARVRDPFWRLPLWPGYEADIEPAIADLDNAPKGGFAGAITAALFLRRFAGGGPWAHFDIYGWCPSDRPGCPKGGECQAARAMFAMLAERYGGGA